MSNGDRADDLLEAPCVFCGYHGDGYWGVLTHANWCPFYRHGGKRNRRFIFRAYISRCARLAKAAERYIDESPCDPDITEAQIVAYAEYQSARMDFAGATGREMGPADIDPCRLPGDNETHEKTSG